MPIFIILALLLGGGGVSLEAQKAVPGDALYSWKTHVNESVGGALAIGAEAKAEHESAVAEERLKEAEELEAKGDISADAKAELEANFKDFADRIAARAAELQADGKADQALDLTSRFETALQAHADILAKLAAKNGSTDNDAASLLSDILEKGRDITKARVEAEAKVSTDVSGDFKASAEGKIGAAQNKIDEVQKFIDDKKDELGVTATAAAEAGLQAAKDALARAKDLVSTKSGEAFVLAAGAERLAQQAKLLGEAKTNFKIDVGSTVRVGNIEVGQDGHVKVNGDVDVNASGTVNVGGIHVKMDDDASGTDSEDGRIKIPKVEVPGLEIPN